jgi:hypothetical protein
MVHSITCGPRLLYMNKLSLVVRRFVSVTSADPIMGAEFTNMVDFGLCTACPNVQPNREIADECTCA